MTSERWANLHKPYTEGEDIPEPTAALGIALPSWAELQREIFEDFLEVPPHGISWWSNVENQRKLLIGDHLYSCVTSVIENLTEAALHKIELGDWTEAEDRRIVDVVKRRDEKWVVVHPRPATPLDQLKIHFVRMHRLGVVRALSSALDCLAGVIIGIAAIPMNILKADLQGLRKYLATLTGDGSGGRTRQVALATALEALIANAGPDGWLEWTLDYRNMLVHRGRRIEYGQFVPRVPVLHGPDGAPVLRFRRATHLPRDPGRSDVEVFAEIGNWSFALQEESLTTIDGLLKSTLMLIERIGPLLADFWRWRRQNPRLLIQPVKQWPHGRSTTSTNFFGYKPGSVPLQPDLGSVSPEVRRRLLAAALDDQNRAKWASGF